MRHRKPLGWPKLMVCKRLKSGATAYYWDIPTWAKKKGCSLYSEPLGADYATLNVVAMSFSIHNSTHGSRAGRRSSWFVNAPSLGRSIG